MVWKIRDSSLWPGKNETGKQIVAKVLITITIVHQHSASVTRGILEVTIKWITTCKMHHWTHYFWIKKPSVSFSPRLQGKFHLHFNIYLISLWSSIGCSLVFIAIHKLLWLNNSVPVVIFIMIKIIGVHICFLRILDIVSWEKVFGDPGTLHVSMSVVFYWQKGSQNVPFSSVNAHTPRTYPNSLHTS